MEIEVHDDETGVRRVTLTGRLDTTGAGQVELRFTVATASAATHSLVDLAGVTFLSSMGIRVLVSCAKAAKARGGRIVLWRPQALVAESLADAGLEAVFPIVDDEAQAVALLTA